MEEIQRIIRSYFKSLYFTKLGNTKEMDNFLNKNQLPKLNQDQISKLNRPIMAEGIETVIKSFPKKKSPEPDGFSSRIIQVILILLKWEENKHCQIIFMRLQYPDA